METNQEVELAVELDPEQEIEQKVRELLQRVGLEQAIHLMPEELSGGMHRRVSIARSLAALMRGNEIVCGPIPNFFSKSSAWHNSAMTSNFQSYRPSSGPIPTSSTPASNARCMQ